MQPFATAMRLPHSQYGFIASRGRFVPETMNESWIQPKQTSSENTSMKLECASHWTKPCMRERFCAGPLLFGTFTHLILAGLSGAPKMICMEISYPSYLVSPQSPTRTNTQDKNKTASKGYRLMRQNHSFCRYWKPEFLRVEFARSETSSSKKATKDEGKIAWWVLLVKNYLLFWKNEALI